jgi:hypothetical protein
MFAEIKKFKGSQKNNLIKGEKKQLKIKGNAGHNKSTMVSSLHMLC